MLPSALAEKPEPEFEVTDLMTAFFDLSPSRPTGMGGVGAIPVSEIVAYAGMVGVDDLEQFFRRIRSVDVEFLNWHSKKNGA